MPFLGRLTPPAVARCGWSIGLFSPVVLPAICFVFLFCAAVELSGARPTLEHLHPAAFERGSSNNIVFPGKFDPWPPKAWVSCSGIEVAFPTNKGQATITVEANVEPGPKLLRLYNDEGASEPVIFVVPDGPVLAETEPNNQFRKPQSVTNFPATISGRLEKNNDVDSFSFRAKAGQWLDARMESHVLKSEIDGVLRLVTPDGYQLAWNHDFSSLDPRLIWQAARDETVVLQVFGFVYPANAEIRLSGGDGGVYLLRASLADDSPEDLNRTLCEESVATKLPLEVHGTICPAGDEDIYSVELKKDELIEARVSATDFGSPLDPWLAVRNNEGKELSRNDDAEGSRDSRLEWKAPTDGKYSLVVGSVTHQGSEDWRYSLRVKTARADCLAHVSESGFVLESSATNEVKVTIQRLRGFTNELSVQFENLPEGVTAEPVQAGATSSDVTLKLISKDAAPHNGPMRIVLRDGASSLERAATFELVSRSENNGVPGGYGKLLVERTDQLWLTVKPKTSKK